MGPIDFKPVANAFVALLAIAGVLTLVVIALVVALVMK